MCSYDFCVSGSYVCVCAHYVTGLLGRHIIFVNTFVYGLYHFAQLKVVHACN